MCSSDLPPYVQTIEEQASQTYAQMQTKVSDLEKRLFLMEIFNTNRTLFYYLFSKHLEEFNPIVYDPTIADTIEGYSRRRIGCLVFLKQLHQRQRNGAGKSTGNQTDGKVGDMLHQAAVPMLRV